MEFNATFLVSIISFILFTAIMNMIFYKPIAKIINERQKFIDDNICDAKNSNAKADEILKDRDNRLNNSIKQAKKIISDKLTETNETSRQFTDNAKQEARQNIENAKQTLISDADNYKNELEQKIIDLAEIISSKVLGERV